MNESEYYWSNNTLWFFVADSRKQNSGGKRRLQAIPGVPARFAGDESPDAVILEHLGDAYHAAKQPEKARSAWQRALEGFDPEHNKEEIERTKEKLKALGEE